LWDIRFLELARLVSGWSKDPSTKVGAVVTDGKFVVSTGYNGYPAGVPDDGTLENRAVKYQRTLHAETNAVLLAMSHRGPVHRLDGCTLYVTAPPCGPCTALAIQARISRIVWLAPDPSFAERWADHTREAKLMLDEAGVPWQEYPRGVLSSSS